MNYTQRPNNSGFSAIAAVIIGAIVVVGGVAAISATSESEVNSTATTTQDSQPQDQKAVFSCEGNQEVAVEFSNNDKATVTLPSGKVTSVTKVQTDEGVRYRSESEALVFAKQDGNVTVRQNGKAVVEGCVEVSNNSKNEATSSAKSETQAGAEANTEAEVEAETNVEAQTEAEGNLESEVQGQTEASVGASADTTVVTYTNDGFSPQTVTVNVGDTVRFENESSGGMWVGSDVHPTHSKYDGTSRTQHCADGGSDSFDQCGVGDVYEFTFDKTGSFGYHNHVNSSDNGTIVVE